MRTVAGHVRHPGGRCGKACTQLWSRAVDLCSAHIIQLCGGAPCLRRLLTLDRLQAAPRRTPERLDGEADRSPQLQAELRQQHQEDHHQRYQQQQQAEREEVDAGMNSLRRRHAAASAGGGGPRGGTGGGATLDDGLKAD